MTHNTYESLIERNKELLNKIEEKGKELKKLEHYNEIVLGNYNYLNNDNLNNKTRIRELEKELENHNELKKELEEKELLIEHWKQRAERGEEDAEIHLKALTETSKEWNERKLEWWVEVFYKKLLDLNTVRNWQIESNLETIKVKDDDLEKASEKIKVLENFVAWQKKVADKQFQELPALPKKTNKFKILASKVKNRVNETKVAVKEKFNAYILQKSK